MKRLQSKLGWVAAMAAAGMLFGTSCAVDRYGGDFFAPVYGFGSVVDEFFFDVGYFDDDFFDDDYYYYGDDYYYYYYYDDDYYDDWWD